MSASSTLSSQYGYSYDCSNVLQNDDTCWCEGASGYGEGEYILLFGSTEQSVYGVYLINGYAKSEDIYNKNCRVKSAKFEFSDGTVLYRNIADASSEQTISFDMLINTTYIKMTIVSVYEGGEYEDTCISFIDPY